MNSAKYVSSFIGIAPAEEPAVTIAVVMDEPKVGGRDGGQVAGPVFREIAQKILPELNIEPEGELEARTDVEYIPEIIVPNGPSAETGEDRLPESIFIRPKTVYVDPLATDEDPDAAERGNKAPVKAAPSKPASSQPAKPAEKPKAERKPAAPPGRKSEAAKKKGKT